MLAYSAEDIEKNNKRAAEKARARKARRAEEGVDSGSSSSSEDEYDGDEGGVDIDMMRRMAAQKKKEVKPKGVEAVIEVRNLNSSSARREDAGKLSRKDREAAEKERKRQEYMKKHLKGETEEARRDMERLALIRKRREEAAQRAKEEAEAAAARKKKKAEESSDDEDELENLTSREIKKMNPTKLKAELKRRKQSTQGNKKSLQQRLLDWCKSNQK